MPRRQDGAKPLSVAFLVHHFPAWSETFVAELADGLVDAGHDLRILALNGRIEGSALRPELERLTRRPTALPWPFPMLGPVAETAGQAAMLRRAGRFDVVHCQFATAGLMALRHLQLGTLRTRALVVHLRGYDVTRFVAERGAGIYDPLFRRGDLFIASSRSLRDRALALGCPDDRLVVIGSPIDTDRFAPPPERVRYGGPARLVVVGRLVEKKGFADAVAAVALLRDGGRDVRLDVLGDGPLRPVIEAEVARLGLGDRVRLHGIASGDRVLAAFHAADIALAPSLRPPSGDEEGIPNVLKEAMATGLPVIATRHGGAPELVISGENGDLVPEGDPAALADAIARLLDAPDSWSGMGAAGRRKVVAEYDRVRIAEETLAAYHRTLSQGAARTGRASD